MEGISELVARKERREVAAKRGHVLLLARSVGARVARLVLKYELNDIYHFIEAMHA